MSSDNLVTEVPSSLKQLARLIVRGFYTIEDALIIDMLVRNPCMKEDDICELLKFERKMLRARIAILKNDKFIQTRLRMETGIDGKAQKINYYFINYKTFVNVVKYKLDIMRKRLETEERDATSRASFKCPQCLKTFTDLEADQLFDFVTGEFRCTYCGSVVEEDQSALPRQDSRQMMVKFNSQLEPIFILLREVEGIRLAPKVLEPEPVDINTIRGFDGRSNSSKSSEQWSGEASRNQGFLVEEARVDIQFGDKETPKEMNKKERPIWMVESTVLPNGFNQTNVIVEESNPSNTIVESTAPVKGGEDIMSYLLQHERRSGTNQTSLAAASLAQARDDNSDSSNDMDNNLDNRLKDFEVSQDVETLESEEEEEEMPSVMVGDVSYLLSEIDDKVIAKMTPGEKSNYISVYQDYYSRVYD